MKSPIDVMNDAINLFSKKSHDDNYGDGHIRFGEVMVSLFPNGLTINSKKHWIILGIFIQIISKIMRLSINIFEDKPKAVEKREDNSMDMTVYSSMLTSVLINKYSSNLEKGLENPKCFGKFTLCKDPNCVHLTACKTLSTFGPIQNMKKPICFGRFFASGGPCKFVCNIVAECEIKANEELKETERAE